MVDSMNVRIYPNKQNDDDLITAAREGLDEAFSQTIDYFANNGEQIDKNIEVDKSHPSITGDAFIENDNYVALTQWGDWLVSHGKDQTAVHMLLTSGLSGGISGGTLGGAWRNDPAAVIGRTGGDRDYFKSLCVHEAYHLFLNTGTLFTGTSGRTEHILGEVIPTGSASVAQTPMVNGYLDDGLAAQGDCNNTATSAPFTTKLSDCTLKRTLESYRDQGNLVQY